VARLILGVGVDSVPKRRLLNAIRRRTQKFSPMQMEQKQCSETSAFKCHMPENNPKDLAYEDGTDSVPKRRILNTTRRRTRKIRPMKMKQTQCSETSVIKHHTPENNPTDYTRHSEHGESLKSRIKMLAEKTLFDRGPRWLQTAILSHVRTTVT
jgi:hypothetical protein